MRFLKTLFAVLFVVFVMLGCSVNDGADGVDGENGSSCTVTDNGDGTKTISCDDGTSATINDGTDGEDSSSCTVADNGDGTKTISCDDGTSVTISDGTDGEDGSSCTVADNGDGTKTVSCDDGTSVTISDGTDGEDGVSCTVVDNLDCTYTLSCDNGTSVTWGSDGSEYVLMFDDAYAEYGEGANPENYYGAYGIHFDNEDGYGLIGGEGNGDPGNWNIEGTNGSAAWGLWEGTHSISFDTPANGLSVDFLRAFSDVTEVTVTAYLDGDVVATQTFSLSGAYDVDTVTFTETLDMIEWTSSIIFGLDNVQYSGCNGPAE